MTEKPSLMVYSGTDKAPALQFNEDEHIDLNMNRIILV